MQTPEPVRTHRELEKLAGHFAGPERMHPSYFNDEAKKADAVADAHVALDGFAVVQDYEQRLEDGSRFAGHGVFRYDMASETYEMHWFDSTGGPERIFRGGFQGNKLVLTARAGEGWQRLTYDFNLDKGYRMKLETSEDGERWKLALEGDNIIDRKAPARKSAGRKKTGAKKMTAKKTTGKKTAAAKKTTHKASAKKASPKRKAAAKSSTRLVAKKKTRARKATAKTAPVRARAKKKAGAKKTASRKTAGRKAAAKKTMAGKKAAKKTGAKKATAKKATAKKATAKKPATKKAGAKKSAPKKTTAKKATAKKATAKKATAKKTVAPIEKQRRQGRASRKIGTKKHARAGDGAAASTPVSQKRTKGAAHKGPRMPNLKNTSTRVGWHKTAAKGR
ncbi:MAG TPA: histone H1-like repetitive region-containing protein [Gammaproteobacteria bacterium]